MPTFGTMKKTLVIGWLVILLIAVGALFWYNELQYQLPTPVPENYKAVKQGTIVSINPRHYQDRSKPLFLHFFNPDCPCSRFNIKQFKAIAQQYHRQVNFAIVIMSSKHFTESEIQDKFGMKLPVIFDPSVAEACGVYSTPQAALIDTGSKLYYRGNYNISRYCTDEKTSFAKVAINGLLNDNTRLTFNKLALTTYGCRLPDCHN
jgi:hypothetical protein